MELAFHNFFIVKKFLYSALLIIGLALSLPINAQENYSENQRKEFAKNAEKESKAVVKKLVKEKWIFNGVGTLQGAYTRYLLQSKDYGGEYTLLSYEINNAPNLRNGEKGLMNMAQSAYAQENEAYLISEQKAHSGEVDITLEDNVIKALAQFNGDVKRSFIIHRKNSNGTYDMRGYYLVDSDNTRSKLRKLAQSLAEEHSMGDDIVKRLLNNEGD